MRCPSCNENIRETLECQQCGGTFCDKCQTNWDVSGEICSGCSEANTVAAFKDDAWTAKLRRWFTKKLEPPTEPDFGLPWEVHKCDWRWALCSGKLILAEFEDKAAADYACSAANKHYQLCGLAVIVHNRIRTGDAWFDGSKEDCEIWTQLKTLMK